MYRKIVFLVLFILLLIPISAGQASASPQLIGKSAVLLDAKSGQVLYELDKDLKLPPASITKIMTALLAIESGRLEETVTIGANPPLVEGTRVYLEKGEKIKLIELVRAAMIHSANDAALAVAEYLSGTAEEFSVVMNQRARDLGAVNSNFITPHGLHQDNHYTSAYDIALIAREALKNETFRQIAASKILDWEGQAWQTRLININNLLWSYDGADGVKTGYTKESKNTIVASATRGGKRLLAVVLGSSGQDVWRDASKLLDYGFNNFRELELADPDIVVATVDLDENKQLELIPRDTFSLMVSADDDKKIESKVLVPIVTGSVQKGEVIGEMVFALDGIEAGRVALLANNDINISPKISLILLYLGAGLFLLQMIWRIAGHIRRVGNRKRRYGYYNRRSY
jgi:serine-type D-Ala-D-Ala carboxypeptidase (penicillin-binding protein 5/6)